ncbi:MAG: lipopolysaccharide heptosyltransferase I [Rugosibacter sp.]
MRILLVKTSSLGDVIHNLPVVTDLRKNFPQALIDWVVEESFADIPRLHPGVHAVLPVAWRRWRKSLYMRSTWLEMCAFRHRIRQENYDLVIDTQGLLKSALIAGLAHGKQCGLSRASAREPLAACCYEATFTVSPALHAVTRNRQLVAQAAGYALHDSPDYGLAIPPSATARRAFFAQPPCSASTAKRAGFFPAPSCCAGGSSVASPAPSIAGNKVMLLTATSRDDKLWPEENWVVLGRALYAQGLRCLLPTSFVLPEQARTARLTQAIPDAKTLPPLNLHELADIMAGMHMVIGLDTGLTHLAAALQRPVIALFCASDPAENGVLAAHNAINLGARGAPPQVADVLATVQSLL